MTIYGYNGTIHHTQKLNIEKSESGEVVSVWFRCLALPFDVTTVDGERVKEMRRLSYDINSRVDLQAVDYIDRTKTSKPVHNHLGGKYVSGCPACFYNPPHENLIQIPTAAPLEDSIDIGQQKAIETGWLIETVLKGGAPWQINGIVWLTVKLGLFDWTDDSLKAVRFARKEDAETMIPRVAEVWPGSLIVTEHQWS